MTSRQVNKEMSLKLKTLVLSMIAAIVNVACSSEAPIKNDDAAAQAAKCYYDSLNNGGYEYFTDMYHRQERIPDSYREQLVANTKMYLDNIRKEHKGISEVTHLYSRRRSQPSGTQLGAHPRRKSQRFARRKISHHPRHARYRRRCEEKTGKKQIRRKASQIIRRDRRTSLERDKNNSYL